jgi:hypothetical protein
MCPQAYITNKSRFLFEQFVAFRRLRALPKAGGLNDQDNLIIEAFLVMQTAIDRHEEIEDKKRKHDADRQLAQAKNPAKARPARAGSRRPRPPRSRRPISR